ncbi:hypothetical protein SynBIOSE41_04406 [Synechococcus sp. BIOS-E4-1]|nr:hypothetical protein SynBIOSE41_04406 [Synechococcus sp. BIOS-E4-1]
MLRILVEGDLISKDHKICVVLGTQFTDTSSISRSPRVAEMFSAVAVKRELMTRQSKPDGFSVCSRRTPWSLKGIACSFARCSIEPHQL